MMYCQFRRVLSGLSACFALLLLSVAFSSTTTNAGEFPADSSRDVRLLSAKVRAAQFLSRATFGPSQETIDELAARIMQIGYRRAMNEWIDQQWELPASSHEQVARDLVALNGRTITQDGVGISSYRYQAWWHIALTGEDQLRQRVAWALSQIFVIGDSGQSFNNNDDRSIGNGERSLPDWLGMSNFYDILANGASGTYRELLGNVTFHPCMGTWLSSVRNRKADLSNDRFPDENYAREIMQLFSVGLYELHSDGRQKVNDQGELIPTYDNAGIKELARLFTGFKFHHNTSSSLYVGRHYGTPMRVQVSEHDNNYDYSNDPNAPPSKTVFGETLPPLAQPFNEQACIDEISAGLDVIANQSTVAPFICRLLIQRLVKSNPSRAYMRRVTRVFDGRRTGVRGDMKAVVKAILTDPEAFRSQRVVRRRNPMRVEVTPRGTEYSRLREPINRVTSLIRAMRPTSDYEQGYMMLSHSIRDDIGQMPFRSPTVFNYYLPDFQPPGDLIGYTPSRRNPNGALYAPEFQILNAVTSNRTINRLRSFATRRYVDYSMRVGRCRISFDLSEEIELARDLDNLDEILRRFDLLLCNGSMSEVTKTNIKDAVIAETTGRDYLDEERVEEILCAVILSPDCTIEQ